MESKVLLDHFLTRQDSIIGDIREIVNLESPSYNINGNRSVVDLIEIWVNEVVSKCPDIPIVVCGNKFDLNEARSIEKEEMLDYSKLHKFDYVETSALSGFNVDKLFYHASRLSHQYGDSMLKFRKEYSI